MDAGEEDDGDALAEAGSSASVELVDPFDVRSVAGPWLDRFPRTASGTTTAVTASPVATTASGDQARLRLR